MRTAVFDRLLFHDRYSTSTKIASLTLLYCCYPDHCCKDLVSLIRVSQFFNSKAKIYYHSYLIVYLYDGLHLLILTALFRELSLLGTKSLIFVFYLNKTFFFQETVHDYLLNFP